jgi:hypothetical protein
MYWHILPKYFIKTIDVVINIVYILAAIVGYYNLNPHMQAMPIVDEFMEYIFAH